MPLNSARLRAVASPTLSRLLEIAEKEVATKGDIVGIGVGLYEDYGPAQRLYIKRGYIPDGKGGNL